MNTHRNINRSGALLLLNGLSLATVVTAYGQDVVIEEVLVTARAREETLQDVPISISTVSGKTIDETGIDNLEELATSVPNFTVTQDPIGDKINIRGIFTGEIASLEQSVSTFVDGVNRGRGTQSRFAFLDVERVEVLRGPQGTLFGKNTVGGALNLTTRKPTRAFSANVNAGYETELEETTVAGFVSGPLTEALRGRVAFSTSNQDEGYIENRFYNNSTPNSENNVVRGSVDWDVGSNTLLRLRAEYGEFELDGQPFALRSAGPLAPLLQQGFGVESGSLTETAIGQTRGGPLDIGSSGTMEGDSQEVAATLQQSFANGSSLEVVTAFQSLDFKRRLDADFSPLDLLGFDDTEDYEQTSLSVRLLSADEGKLRYVTGLYYQSTDLSLTGLTSLNTPTAAAVSGQACQATGLSPLEAQQVFGAVAALAAGGVAPPESIGLLQRAGSAAAVNACTTFGATQTFPLALSRPNTLDQKGDAFAIYGQADYDLTDKLQLTVGLRYTLEQKDARQTVFGSNFGTRQLNTDLDLPLAVLFEASRHDFGRDVLDREENKLNYSASLQLEVTDDVNAYLSTSSGFKAGGFNAAAFGPTADEAEFEPEEVVSYELGLKTTLLDGAAQLNAALFFTSIEDLQVAQFTGGTSFIVQNAAEAEVRGLELDARWQLSSNFGVSASAAYTDFEFTSFPRAGCNVQQLLALRQGAFDQGAALVAAGNTDLGLATQLLGSNQTLRECSALGINDLKGRTTEQVPEYTAQFGIDYRMEFGNSFAIDTVADVVWNDEQFRQTDLDPETKSGSFAKTNLALSFSRIGAPWKVSLVGRNIFDKKTFSYANDTPLLDNARQQIVDRPRTVKLQLQYDFK